MFSDVWLWLSFVILQGKLTASAVGQIVGLQSAEIKQIASEYAEKVSLKVRTSVLIKGAE